MISASGKKNEIREHHLGRDSHMTLFFPGTTDDEFARLQEWYHDDAPTRKTVQNGREQTSSTCIGSLSLGANDSRPRAAALLMLADMAFVQWRRCHENFVGLCKTPGGSGSAPYMSAWLSLEQLRSGKSERLLIAVGAPEPFEQVSDSAKTVAEMMWADLRQQQLNPVAARLDKSVLLVVGIADQLPQMNAFAVMYKAVRRDKPELKQGLSLLQWQLLHTPLVHGIQNRSLLSVRKFNQLAAELVHQARPRPQQRTDASFFQNAKSTDMLLRELADHKCSGCGRLEPLPPAVKLKVCSGCGFIRYCSKECQRGHWNVHKPECLAFRRDQEHRTRLGAASALA